MQSTNDGYVMEMAVVRGALAEAPPLAEHRQFLGALAEVVRTPVVSVRQPARPPLALLVAATALAVVGAGVMTARSGATFETLASKGATVVQERVPVVFEGPNTFEAARYQVRPRDTIDRVAALHAVPLDRLAAANGLQPPYTLKPGAMLVVPHPPTAGTEPLPDALRTPVRQALVPVFDRWAAEYGLPADLLKAVAWRESRWREDAMSVKGAVGVGQLLPSTARWVSARLIGEPLDPWKADQNVRLSARYLSWLLERNGGNHAGALADYFQGHESTRTGGWLAVTDRYVHDVFALRWRFRAAAAPRTG